MPKPHTGTKWLHAGQSRLLHPVTMSPLLLERIETPLGYIEILDETNEPAGNLDLIVDAPAMHRSLVKMVDFIRSRTRALPSRDPFLVEIEIARQITERHAVLPDETDPRFQNKW